MGVADDDVHVRRALALARVDHLVEDVAEACPLPGPRVAGLGALAVRGVASPSWAKKKYFDQGFELTLQIKKGLRSGTK